MHCDGQKTSKEMNSRSGPQCCVPERVCESDSGSEPKERNTERQKKKVVPKPKTKTKRGAVSVERGRRRERKKGKEGGKSKGCEQCVVDLFLKKKWSSQDAPESLCSKKRKKRQAHR